MMNAPRLGGALRDFEFYYQNLGFSDVCRILVWHLGGLGSMENTPTGCADDLPTILRNSKNEPKSRSVNIVIQWLNFDPNSSTKKKCSPATAPPSE